MSGNNHDLMRIMKVIKTKPELLGLMLERFSSKKDRHVANVSVHSYAGELSIYIHYAIVYGEPEGAIYGKTVESFDVTFGAVREAYAKIICERKSSARHEPQPTKTCA